MRYKLCFCKRHKENILIPKLAAADEYANICLCPAYKTGRFCEETRTFAWSVGNQHRQQNTKKMPKQKKGTDKTEILSCPSVTVFWIPVCFFLLRSTLPKRVRRFGFTGGNGNALCKIVLFCRRKRNFLNQSESREAFSDPVIWKRLR